MLNSLNYYVLFSVKESYKPIAHYLEEISGVEESIIIKSPPR